MPSKRPSFAVSERESICARARETVFLALLVELRSRAVRGGPAWRGTEGPHPRKSLLRSAPHTTKG